MKKFKVIQGSLEESLRKKEEIKNKKLYLFQKNFYSKLASDTGKDFISGIWNGINYVNLVDINDLDLEDLKDLLDDILLLKEAFSLMSPRLVLYYFPIEKYFDGYKFGAKDFWSTMEYIKTLNLDYSIGEHEIDNFFWNYYNLTLINFSIKELLVIDRIRKFSGEPSLAQEFADFFGLDTYTINREEGYILNNRTHKTSKLVKSIPKYLKRIK